MLLPLFIGCTLAFGLIFAAYKGLKSRNDWAAIAYVLFVAFTLLSLQMIQKGMQTNSLGNFVLGFYLLIFFGAITYRLTNEGLDKILESK